MKKTKKIGGLVSGITLASILLVSAVMTGALKEFQDMKGKHWVEKAGTFSWANQRNMVNGYTDGTFKPEGKVTEAEFLSFLLRSYGESTTSGKGQPWYQKAYDVAGSFHYPTKGKANAPILRTQVAELVAATQGVHYQGEDAIKYLLVKGLSKGKTKATVAGFQGQSVLTRAESIQFIYNVLQKGVPQLEERPSQPSDVVWLQQAYASYLEQNGLEAYKESYVDDLQNGTGHQGKTYDPNAKSVDTSGMKPGDTISLD